MQLEPAVTEMLKRMAWPELVRDLRQHLDDYVAGQPKDAKGHPRFDYKAAVGHVTLRHEFEEATTLYVIDGTGIRRIARPGNWVKRAPLKIVQEGKTA